MTPTRIALIVSLLAACTEMDSSTTTVEEQELGGNFCTAKFPQLQVWNGQTPPPQLSSGMWVSINTPYAGWRLYSLVDVNKGTIPHSIYVHTSQLQAWGGYTINAALVGPGGNPPPPPCDQGPTVRCGQWKVAFAQRVHLAQAQAFQDCQTCGN